MLRLLLVVTAAPLLLLANPRQASRTSQAKVPSYTRVYELKPKEGVFAYARISPDGNTLAYASEGSRSNTVTVVDLPTKKVLFTEAGIDAYFSTDGERMIYLSQRSGANVTIRNMQTGALTRSVAPVALGDYFSWAFRDNKHLILTIQSNYYYLNGDKAVLPHSRVPTCPGTGVGDRPLISRDGMHISTFVGGNIVVRSLSDCSTIINTGIKGQKADFSWDGRYVAFHSAKPRGGYAIQIVDTKDRTVRTLSGLDGSAYFPSWTKDGRLSFRYDGADYKGFMMASDVLSAPAVPLPKTPTPLPARRTWNDIFAGTPAPSTALSLVLVWAPWSAHSKDAFIDLDRARALFASRRVNVSVAAAADPGSSENEITRQLAIFGGSVPRIPLGPSGLALTEASNQMPTTLLFRGGVLVDQRLGAQTFEQLRDWVLAAAAAH
jgi:hypothetical protein